jgi:Fe2+ transport system protein FeoA
MRGGEGRLLTCPICGFAFDPSENPSCPSCPLAAGCTAACCPNCGHDTVDPGRSRLVALATRLARALRRGPSVAPAPAIAPGRTTLAQLAPGGTALISDLDGLDVSWREHLQAYGLVPGRNVDVVQQAPVTVVQVDHTNVALERRLARGIGITARSRA